jgi:copper chaperone
MSCGGCEQTVETALEDLDGVSHVEADHETDSVELDAEDSVTEKTLHETIEQAGYDVTA